MVKILIGGSPCTHWSIAQKNNRETEPQGEGWELFKNYLIAKEKFKPDFFLYENNKSAAQAIKDQISKELGVPLQYINSALVSAQNRQRFYAHNIPNVPQPEDKGILLRDILESGTDLSQNEKSYCMTASYNGAVAWNTLEKKQRTIKAQYFKNGMANFCCYSSTYGATGVAEPVACRCRGRKDINGNSFAKYECRTDSKGNTLDTNTTNGSMVAEPLRVGCYPSPDGTIKNSQGMRLYSIEGKSVGLTANGGGMGDKTGLYVFPIEFIDDIPVKAISLADGKTYTVYGVKDGQITIKDKQYKIKLADGYYIIRKLTPIECERLQTLPDNYTAGISNTQRYKCLGNGWTAEVIIHILKHMSVPLDEEIVVLSMYDGIATGRYCLDKLGYKNITYYAYEINKYAKQVAMNNYPNIIQCGDAFDVRKEDWTLD